MAVLPNIPGFLHQVKLVDDGVFSAAFDTLYTYAWFVGFGLAGAVYLALMKLLPGPRATPISETP